MVTILQIPTIAKSPATSHFVQNASTPAEPHSSTSSASRATRSGSTKQLAQVSLGRKKTRKKLGGIAEVGIACHRARSRVVFLGESDKGDSITPCLTVGKQGRLSSGCIAPGCPLASKQMDDLELVQAGGLKPAVDALRRRGINADFYLQRHGIPSDFVELPYAPIPKRERLWAFLDDVEEQEGLETLGFLIGDRMDLTAIGPFGLLLTKASTLLDALRILQHNISNFAQKNSIGIRHEGDKVWIYCESYKKTCRPADHLTLMFLISVVRLAAGQDWCPSEVQLQSGPVKDLHSLPLLANCTVEFDRSHAAVAVNAAMLSQPLLNYDPDKPDETIVLTPLPDTGRLGDSLRVVIAALLPYHGPPSAEDAARMVGVSRSTLFRRLADEKTTYRELVEEVRFQLARACLRNPKLSNKDISFLLGYSNPNNFIRAFRNLAGLPPNEFRRENQTT